MQPIGQDAGQATHVSSPARKNPTAQSLHIVGLLHLLQLEPQG